jgi:ketosteroid isomerase-like protein
MTSAAVLGLIVASACAAPPAAPQFTPEDEAAVAAMFTQTVADFRGRDFANWASRFSEDAVFHAPNQPAITGRAAMQAWAEALPPIEAIEFTNVRVRGSGDVAWGVSDYALTLQGMPTDRGKQLAVARRVNGAWQGVAVSFNSDLPLPAAAGAGSLP